MEIPYDQFWSSGNHCGSPNPPEVCCGSSISLSVTAEMTSLRPSPVMSASLMSRRKVTPLKDRHCSASNRAGARASATVTE